MGYFKGTVDFGPGTDTFNLTSTGNIAIFISKLDSAGNFVWVKRLGGTGYDQGLSIAIDASGNVYTTVAFEFTCDFDPGAGNYNVTSSGSDQIFISKLDPTGKFVWAKRLGGANRDYGSSLALDDSGNIYTVGNFEGTADFDPDPAGVFNLTSAGKSDIFLHKMADCLSSAIAGAISGNKTICSGSSNTYSIKAVSGATSYTWTLPNGWSGTSTTDSITTTASATSGNISVTPHNACGSSSAQLLNVTLNPIVNTSLSHTGCNSYTFKGNSITASGTYYDSLNSAQGCNSIVILDLTINNRTSSIFSHTACYNYTSNGSTYTASGVYVDTIPNAAFCDSIITLNLTINNSTNSSFSHTACYSYLFNGITYTASGIYADTIPNAACCDSIIILNLTINKSTSSSISVNACKEHLFNGTSYTASGIYVDTIPNAAGCDSIITLDLIIYNVNVVVTQNNSTLTGTQASANYQWLDCKIGYTEISGAKNKSYTAKANGDYAVAVMQNGCSDTSACVTVSSIGISPSPVEDLSRQSGRDGVRSMVLYPNPNNGEFTIQSSSKGIYILINELGQAMQVIQLNKAKNHTVNIGNLSAGVYFIVGCSNSEMTRQKVVVMK